MGLLRNKFWLYGIFVFALPSLALAEDILDSGDTSWLLTSTALVLFMTIPGLSLFYAGLVRSKNVLIGFDAMFHHYLFSFISVAYIWLQHSV